MNNLKQKVIDFSGKKLSVSVADTEKLRNQGLMGVSHLEENEGMLFVFNKNQLANFWMKNTNMPLDIAFIDQNLNIVKISTMSPIVGSENSGNILVKYAVEAPAGWFRKNKIKVGQKMSLSPKTVQSSGVIILDYTKPQIKALCVLSGFDQWDFPKGHQEANETLIETAIREVEEETGLRADDYTLTGEKAPPITYRSGNKIKTATYYIGERLTDTSPTLPIDPNLGISENVEWRWFNVSQLWDVMPKRFQPILVYLDGVCNNNDSARN